MKKHQTRQKTVNDPVIVSRVKNYLAENVDKTFVDVSQMARSLRERYREYNNRSEAAFCQLVEGAYKVVLQSYGLDGATSSEPDDESDLELLDESSRGALNERLLEMYNMQDKKRHKAGEPIDILSSDEDGTSAAPAKLPKISDQITITPHLAPARRAPADRAVDRAAERPADAPKPHYGQINSQKKKKVDSSKNGSQKKKAEIGSTKPVTVSFEDIGGISEIITPICDLILHMKHPEVYAKLGIKAPRGALLHGPPGTGKTLLAHAIAGKLQLPLLAVSGTELVGGVSGESEERIRELFDRATSIAPSVLFIDEIDAVCGNRMHAQKDMERRMVAQLLTSLDALSESSFSVLVLAASNNPDSLDPALRRAGRLEQEIALGIPTAAARQDILRILCRGVTLGEDVDAEALAQVTPGFVGADLQALVNKASTYAVKRIFNDLTAAAAAATEAEEPPPAPRAAAVNGVKEGEEPLAEDAAPEEAPEVPPAEPVPPAVPAVPEPEPAPSVAADPAPPAIAAPATAADAVSEAMSLLGAAPYSGTQLSGLCIRQGDFLSALRTTRPCAVREGFVTVPDVTWDDVGSLRAVRKELQLAILAPVRYPAALEALGLAAPTGILLCGPPGCGKTLLAKAIANEAGVNFISVKGPELLNMYVGESERAVRTCFRRARNSAPVVVFFDEFDALCPRRSAREADAGARVVNQLLTEMDGMEARRGVFVLAASNRPDVVDPAALRPGRLERVLYVGLPERGDREDILRKLTRAGSRPRLAADVQLAEVARRAEGYSGADLAGLVRAAAGDALAARLAEGPLRAGEEAALEVSAANFAAALARCRPSVSASERAHYDKLRARYASAPDAERDAMDVEPVLASSPPADIDDMDTV